MLNEVFVRFLFVATTRARNSGKLKVLHIVELCISGVSLFKWVRIPLLNSELIEISLGNLVVSSGELFLR